MFAEFGFYLIGMKGFTLFQLTVKTGGKIRQEWFAGHYSLAVPLSN
ncbi:MAG: hypothetical protein LZF63_12870 [Nitrosomonas sp.]|nr:hypothetical protein [Nitrosomonas sp.]